MKSPDLMAVFACSACHDRLDGRTKGEEIDWQDVLRALAETQLHWANNGLITIK